MSNYIESFLGENPGIANIIAMMQGMNIHQLSNPVEETDFQKHDGVPWGNPPLDSDSKNQKTFGTPETQEAVTQISQPPTNSYQFTQPSTLGMFRDYFKNTPKTQPQTGTQIADENFNQAVINEQNRAMIQKLGMFKNIYDSAPEGIQGDFLRKYSSGQADAIRQTAQQLGIDLGAWGDGGSGISTQDSNVAIMRDQYEQAKAAQEKFQSVQDDLRNKYGMSSQEYYDERYNYYRSRGVPHAMAVLRAGQETVPYAKERTGFLKNAIDEYGIDNGTTLNQFGVGVLGEIGEEDTILGTAIANAYAKPLNEYNYQNAMQQLASTQQATMAREQARQNAERWKTMYQERHKDARNDATNQTSIQNTNTREDRQDARTQFIENNKIALKKMEQEYDYFMKTHYSPQQSSANSSTSSKLDKEAYNRLRNMRNRYEDILKSATENQDQATIDTATLRIQSIDKILDYEENPNTDVVWIKDDEEANIRTIAQLLDNGVPYEDVRAFAAANGVTGTAWHNFLKKVEDYRRR